MFFADLLTLEKPRRSKDGYMAVHAKAARSGVYQYLGREIDPEGKHFQADQVVNVYRSPEEVFKPESLGSFVGKPITDDHPKDAVTASNWRDLARGTIMGAVREGDYVGFDLAFLDAGLIKSIDAGKRELSNGYSSEIVIGDGVAPDGTPFQASQADISGNHVAVVEKGRAGSHCRIGDAAICEPILSDEVRANLTDERTYNDKPNGNINGLARRETSNPSGGLRVAQDGDKTVATKTILIDGYQFEVDAALETAVTKLQGQLKDEREGRVADKAANDKALATKDAEIDDLKTKVVDQAKIDELADAKAAVVADAKKIAGDKLGETAGKSVAEVRRMACVAVLGDAALKDKSDEYVEARFDTLKDAKPGNDPVRDALSNGARSNVNDSGASMRNLARASQF
jgi:hypothetical protein